jgi:hypothetical protein
MSAFFASSLKRRHRSPTIIIQPTNKEHALWGVIGHSCAVEQRAADQ